MPTNSRKTRIPRLLHSEDRGIGWYVTYRDPNTGKSKRHRFGQMEAKKAQVLYHRWLAEHLDDVPPKPTVWKGKAEKAAEQTRVTVQPQVAVVKGCLLEVASAVLRYEESRVRDGGGPRAKNTISQAVLQDRKKHIRDFLEYLNKMHGAGAVARMTLNDLSLGDVEGYNRAVAEAGYSASQTTKRMQMVKRIIDRAGRPELGNQLLGWNWDSRDVAHGAPTKQRELPSVKQLEAVFRACGLREQAIVWTAIGLGFGQSDLAALRVGQIDAQGYDMRRGKTGIERYGSTPPLVWAMLSEYLAENPRRDGALMFSTARGRPLVENRNNAITVWWSRLRVRIGDSKDTLGGFYVFRHLGATEYGSRPGCSVGDVKRWLGHSASSGVADVYMKPVSPEYREVVEWVRKSLQTTDVNSWQSSLPYG